MFCILTAGMTRACSVPSSYDTHDLVQQISLKHFFKKFPYKTKFAGRHFENFTEVTWPWKRQIVLQHINLNMPKLELYCCCVSVHI